MIFDVDIQGVIDAKALATAWGIPHEVVIAYMVSERRVPPSFAAVEEWANRPTSYLCHREAT